MYEDGDVDNLHCGHCKYFAHINHNPCTKRIDHVHIRFATPWFKSYDCNQFSGVICSDFEPSNNCKFLKETWIDFETYWSRFKEQWYPPRYVSFILDGNKKIRYRVLLEDFVYGRMMVDGRINAFERCFMRRTKKSPWGYELVVQSLR